MKAQLLVQRWWSVPFVRVAVLGTLGLAIVVGGIALAYELALARVPQHRARLERLVRAHTGLDVRFNELNLRWGWYGPEAVFHRVELGEPGRADVLVRAPELIVGFDAWRSMQSGQLQAGRITFVAPDINLERRKDAPSAAAGTTRGSDVDSENRTRLLQRWRGGRIEIEGGTLRLPDPAGSSDALTLQIRRASLRRSDDDWSASALVFLPERLGHTARVAAQMKGDLSRLKDLQGSLRFDGLRLEFAGWRQVFGAQSAITRRLPASGNGDISFRVAFDHGRLEKADGRVRAQDVSFRGSPWFMAAGTTLADAGMNLPRLRGDWRLAHRATGWLLRVEQLDLGAKDAGDSLPNVSLEVGTGARIVRGTVGETPLESLLVVTNWLAPQIDLSTIDLKGAARDVRFDWSDARPEGSRLHAETKAKGVTFSPPSRNFTLEGLDMKVSASETDVDITVDSKEGKLLIANAPEHPLDELKIASELRLSRQDDGWHLTTPLLTIDRDSTQLILSGSLTASSASDAPLLDVRATLVRAEVPLLKQLLGDEGERRFGAVVTHVDGGRIERLQFQLQTRLPSDVTEQAQNRAQLFTGTLALRDGQIAAGDLWPEIHGLDARLDWNGDRMSASVERGKTGSIELESASATWSVDGARTPQIAGQARGRLEDALQWLLAHPRLEEYTPRLRDFAATGDALFNFDIALPDAKRKPPSAARVRVAALLEAAQLHLAQDLPSIESVRGSLAFDGGRLQRSTLTGRWLGGPVNMRVSEKRDKRATVLIVQAQGLLDAQQLVALTGFGSLPEVAGETPWSGELSYQSQDATRPASWQLEADASLIGVSSRLPEPLAKAVVTAVPLRVEASGSGPAAEVSISLGNRLRSRLALVRAAQSSEGSQSGWRVERGTVSFGSAAAAVPSEPLIAVQGQMDRFDFPAYASLWERAGSLANVPAIVADLIAQQLWMAGRMFPAVRVQAHKAAGSTTELNLESSDLNGSVRWPAKRAEVRLTAQNLDDVERARIVTQLEDAWNDSTVTVN